MSGDDVKIKTEIYLDDDDDDEDTFKVQDFENCDEVTYLARKIREKEALSKEDIHRLHTLKVQLLHEVPPQHQIEVRSGTHVPTRDEIERFTAIVPLKRGSFSPEEDDIIVRNWKKFCKVHQWNKRKFRAFLCLKHSEQRKYISKKKEIKKFVQFLANGLPNRTLYSVYHRYKILYSSHLLRRYTKDEDNIILSHIENNPFLDEKRKFVDVAKVLNRTRASVWRRYQILKRKRKMIESDD